MHSRHVTNAFWYPYPERGEWFRLEDGELYHLPASSTERLEAPKRVNHVVEGGIEGEPVIGGFGLQRAEADIAEALRYKA